MMNLLTQTFICFCLITAILGVAIVLGNTNNNSGNSTTEKEIPINNTPEKLPPSAIPIETPVEVTTPVIIETPIVTPAPIETPVEVLTPIQTQDNTVIPQKKEAEKSEIVYDIGKEKVNNSKPVTLKLVVKNGGIINVDPMYDGREAVVTISGE